MVISNKCVAKTTDAFEGNLGELKFFFYVDLRNTGISEFSVTPFSRSAKNKPFNFCQMSDTTIYYAIGLGLYGAACAFLILTTIWKHFKKDSTKETNTLAKGVRQIFRAFIYSFFAGNSKMRDFLITNKFA